MPASYYFDPALQARRMSRLASLPLAGIDVADAIARRRRNYLTYLRLLGGRAGIAFLFPDLPEGVCPPYAALLVPDRDRLARDLEARGIAVATWWAGYHRALDFSEFPEARMLKDNVLALHLGLGDEQVRSVAEAVLDLA